jgi:hypothetical protein
MTKTKRIFVAALILAALVTVPGIRSNAARVSANSEGTITLTCPETITEGNPIPFTANVNSAEAELPFRWVVSNGQITDGQSTPAIRVASRGLHNQTVTATLELGGKGCVRIFSCSSRVIPADQ